MQFFLQKLRTLCASMTIIDAEPFCIFLQVDCELVLIRLPVDSFMSDGRVALEMRGHISSYGFGYLWEFLVGLLGGLLHLALLTGKVEERPFESLGDEVGGDAFLGDFGGGDNFFKVLTGCSRLNERLFLFVLILIFAGVGIGLDHGDVLRTLDSA